MTNKEQNALLPAPKPEDARAPDSLTQENYQQARQYLKDSALQAGKTNAALLTVCVLCFVQGMRCAAEWILTWGRRLWWRFLAQRKGGEKRKKG